MLAYLCDETLRIALNGRGINYWDVYIREICDFLGIRAQPLALSDLAGLGRRSDVQTLVLGQQSGQNLSEAMVTALDRWVTDGGILIGFATPGLDAVFGNKTVSAIKQAPDDYAIAGYFDLRPHPITHEVHPFLFNEQKLPIVSDIERVERQTGVELARLFDPGGKELNHPAITWNRHGNGYAGYFAFDVAKTVWLLHQGRPTHDVPENRAHPRPPEMTVRGENSAKIPYADEICVILQNMIAQTPQPFIHQIPPKGDRIPDALLYWGGDEYVGPVEWSLTASDWMKAKGLPYHINIQENHPMTPEQLRHIVEDNGHEISLFYYTTADNNFAMTEAMYQRQSDAFSKVRGFRPCATVNSVTRWKGWAEPAHWMRRAGGKADNSFASGPLALEHPLANGSFFGFSFGTSFPFYFYDDAKGGNQRIDYMEQPIVCYEIGHRGSLLDVETPAASEVHLPIGMAIKYHLVMNLFYHPVYIAGYPLCRQAIEEILRYIDYVGATVLHMGNDEVARWWEARSRATVTTTQESEGLTLDCICEYPEGMIVKLLLKKSLREVKFDQRFPARYEIKKEFAGNWLYIVVPSGTHRLTIQFG